jgi:hypothetical protein
LREEAAGADDDRLGFVVEPGVGRCGGRRRIPAEGGIVDNAQGMALEAGEAGKVVCQVVTHRDDGVGLGVGEVLKGESRAVAPGLGMLRFQLGVGPLRDHKPRLGAGKLQRGNSGNIAGRHGGVKNIILCRAQVLGEQIDRADDVCGAEPDGVDTRVWAVFVQLTRPRQNQGDVVAPCCQFARKFDHHVLDAAQFQRPEEHGYAHALPSSHSTVRRGRAAVACAGLAHAPGLLRK